MSYRPTRAEQLAHARQRLHALDAVVLLQDNWVDVLNIVVGSANVDEARRRVATSFDVDLEQAIVMLGVQVQRLSEEDHRRIVAETAHVRAEIEELETET